MTRDQSNLDISVAMCTYNGEEYLRPQLKSILKQTQKPAEIIIGDDRSSDNTIKIIEEFKKNYNTPIKYYQNQSTLGVTKNFEKCIQKCNSDLIALADQDDVWEETKIEVEVDAMCNSDVDLVYHNSTITTNTLNHIGDLWDSIGYTPSSLTDLEMIRKLLQGKNHIQGSTILLDSNMKEYILPIPKCFNHDRYIAIICLLIDGYSEIDKQLLQYRQHPEQDLGIPERGTLLKLIINHLNMSSDEHYKVTKQTAKRMQDIKTFVNNNSEKIDTNTQFIEKEIFNRAEFHANREVIYNKNSTNYEVRTAFRTNVKEGWYWQFQRGWQHLARDLIEVGRLFNRNL